MSKKVDKARSAKTLALIINRFDGRKDFIEQEFKKNAEFKSLCEDYHDCEQALNGWQTSDAAVASQRQQEYSVMLGELERDIHEWLERISLIT